MTSSLLSSSVEAPANAATPAIDPDTLPLTCAPQAVGYSSVVTAPLPADSVRRPSLADWLRARLPRGGRLDEDASGAVEVVHSAAAGDTALTIARSYLDLTEVYRAKDLAAAISAQAPALSPGSEVRIPHLLATPFADPDANRMAWPADRALKGIYVTGETAGAVWPETLERLQAHGLNAIVVDAKGYAGTISYPTRVRLALESGAGSAPPIRDFSRAVRFAHERGIYVIARLTCFHDPWMVAHAPRLSIRSTSGAPLAIGWIDPASVEVQDYLVDLVKEVVDLGADEVQLDYVRFPVEGAGDAVMLKPDGHRARAIRSFVARVHDATAPHHVPLSLDVFGIAASGPPGDVEALGQNLVLLGPDAEAISPMVYPSHYPVGSLGFEQPGDHPAELVSFGTKAAVAKLSAGHVAGTIVRPWLQAAPFRTTTFGPRYIQDEIRSAEESGAVGWLMWDAGNTYWALWKALPVARETTASR